MIPSKCSIKVKKLQDWKGKVTTKKNVELSGQEEMRDIKFMLSQFKEKRRERTVACSVALEPGSCPSALEAGYHEGKTNMISKAKEFALVVQDISRYVHD